MGDMGPSDGSVLWYGTSADSSLSAVPKLHNHNSALCCIAPLNLGTEDKDPCSVTSPRLSLQTSSDDVSVAFTPFSQEVSKQCLKNQLFCWPELESQAWIYLLTWLDRSKECLVTLENDMLSIKDIHLGPFPWLSCWTALWITSYRAIQPRESGTFTMSYTDLVDPDLK